MLKIEHLTKTYGEKKAVDDLSLHIKPGQIYGFIGHNGAGKTTTLKSAVGILAFDSGEIFIDGISVKENPLECKKRIAYIPDNPDLYNYMTGVKYLNFVADIFGVSQEERTRRIEKYAAEVLGHYENRYLNDMPEFGGDASIEQIGNRLFADIKDRLDFNHVDMERLEIGENPLRTYIVSTYV